MTGKHFWCGVLVVSLVLGLGTPARAVDAEGVLIIIAATTSAAAIAAFVTVAAIHHRRNKIVVTGCIIAGDKGMTLTDEEDEKTYLLSGSITGINPGDRMKLEGKRAKQKSPDKTRVWETNKVIKDFGVCQPRS
jgi:hypothetical protein